MLTQTTDNASTAGARRLQVAKKAQGEGQEITQNTMIDSEKDRSICNFGQPYECQSWVEQGKPYQFFHKERPHYIYVFNIRNAVAKIEDCYVGKCAKA